MNIIRVIVGTVGLVGVLWLALVLIETASKSPLGMLALFALLLFALVRGRE